MNKFKEIIPGLIVNTERGWKVEIPHPDPVWVITNRDETMLVGHGGTVLVFSGEEIAKKLMEKVGMEEVFLKCFSWEECIDKFSQLYSNAIVDHKGEDGLYQEVPFRKGI